MLKKNLLFILLLSILTISILDIQISNSLNNKKSYRKQLNSIQSNFSINKIVYDDHGPILIDGNTDFSNQAVLEGWIGNGTINNPFIISNLRILEDTGSLLYIRNVDLFFKVTSNYLSGYNSATRGINLFSSENGIIENNVIKSCTAIIFLENSNKILINNNSCTGGQDGVLISGSNYNNITNNQVISPQFDGIWVGEDSDNNRIINNLVTNSFGDGLDLKQDSEYNYYFNNTVIDSRNNGIHVELVAEHNIFENNTIVGSYWNGIWLGAGNNKHNQFRFNIIYESTQSGIDLESLTSFNHFSSNIVFNNSLGINLDETTTNNSFQYNDLINNDIHAVDSGTYNTFSENYWSDGTSDNLDLSAVLDPYHIKDFTIFFPMVENQEINQSTLISWSPASSFNNLIIYQIEFSEDNGSTWIILGNTTINSNYNLNISQLKNTKEGILKVTAFSLAGLSRKATSSIFSVKKESENSVSIPTFYIVSSLIFFTIFVKKRKIQY